MKVIKIELKNVVEGTVHHFKSLNYLLICNRPGNLLFMTERRFNVVY